ncbi:hypothetical protein HC031_07665 [Planosporangium thailandense]|uniref:Uncharacterized protein n=1 Tax=Planosporangium thailandense TaxID=765197 RepID=A0ABX0XUA9_9ACTN|nr:hypothetical protein [Planosporangium thailandense]NJC69598.1 hypothetical protein [Planosporangium thailandense]
MSNDSRWTHELDGATVQFMPGKDNDPETVENTDAHIYLRDSTHRYATFMTTNEIARVLQRWADTGEGGGGRYFWCSDLVIVPRPGVQAMLDAVQELVRSGEIAVTCSEVMGTGDDAAHASKP